MSVAATPTATAAAGLGPNPVRTSDPDPARVAGEVGSELAFEALGTTVRLIADAPEVELERARAWVLGAQVRLSRFEATSELSSLNRDPATIVPASRLLRRAVAAALWAARATDGLVDPTLTCALERAGYDRSYEGLPLISLAEALPGAPPRAPAAPHRGRRWAEVLVGDATIARPPGLRLDLGGSAKGWIADAVAAWLGEAVVDCGGDVRVTGACPVAVEHPLTGELVHTFDVRDGAVATSGLGRRVWLTPGGPAHHLIDPSTGSPAWTGLAGATALAPTALEAETLAKAALLGGPEGARHVLGRHGGLLLHEDGTAEEVHA